MLVTLKALFSLQQGLPINKKKHHDAVGARGEKIEVQNLNKTMSTRTKPSARVTMTFRILVVYQTHQEKPM
jgi:hypothetical protein